MIARPFTGDAGQLRAHAEPPRLLARAAPAELPLARSATPGTTVYGVGKISDIFAGQRHRRVASRRSRTSTASSRPSGCCASSTTGFVFTNLVETDKLWGHRNDPVNFHRCLQDFDRRLPDLLDALRPGDLLIITSDHGCDPTTPSTDHSREHALLLAYVEGKNAAGRIHEGEFADVGATVNAGSAARRPARHPGQPIVDAVSRSTTRSWSGASTRARRASRRAAAAYRAGRGPGRARAAFDGGGRGAAAAGARGRLRARASSAERIRRELGVGASSPSTSRERMVELDAGARRRRRVGDVQELPFADGAFDCVVAAWMLYHVPDIEPGLRELARVLRPGGRLVAVDERPDAPAASCWELVGVADRERRRSARENGEELLRAALRARSSGATRRRT